METKRILVVDDEASIRDLLRDVLEGAGFEVDTAPDAAAALAQVRDTIYEGAILDFNLPDMDGVMLHREIRQLDTDLAERTLFISGLVQSDDNLGYYVASAGGFLSKPFDIHEILSSVRRLVA